jgi:hypothetical protein
VSSETLPPRDSPPPAGILVLLGSLGLGLLALLLWAGHRLSRSRPEPERSALPPLKVAPAAVPLSLPLDLRDLPAARSAASRPTRQARGPRVRPVLTTGLVLRSPTAARVTGGRESALKNPTAKSDSRPDSPGRDDERPGNDVAPPRRLDTATGAAALGGSLGLEELAPAQTSFGSSPSASPGRAGGD